jgi:hypothetical protein
MELTNLIGDPGDSDVAYIVYKKIMVTTFVITSVVIPFGIWTLKIGVKANVKLVKQIAILLIVSVISFASNTLTYYYLLKKCNNLNKDLEDCPNRSTLVSILALIDIFFTFAAYFCFDLAYILFVFRYLMTGISI